jgi:hypothetical protein
LWELSDENSDGKILGNVWITKTDLKTHKKTLIKLTQTFPFKYEKILSTPEMLNKSITAPDVSKTNRNVSDFLLAN